MLLVTWAVGTPITYSSSSLTIRGPDRIGHQARSWHRDGRNGGYSSRVDALRTRSNVRVNHPQTESEIFLRRVPSNLASAIQRFATATSSLAPVISNATFASLDIYVFIYVVETPVARRVSRHRLKSRGWCNQVP